MIITIMVWLITVLRERGCWRDDDIGVDKIFALAWRAL
jgi:hypothetical protein